MNIKRTFILLACLAVAACGGGGQGSGGAKNKNGELVLGSYATNSIAKVGEVDWYHYRAVEANTVLQVHCASDTFRPDVDLLVTAYELDAGGNKVRIYGDHAPENGLVPADIRMNLYINEPKDIYIAVRDLMDDEASSSKYRLKVDYAEPEDSDSNFSNARPLAADNPASVYTDAIEYIGDIDCYSIDVDASGVYSLRLDFNAFAGGTDVDLTLKLYGEDGEKLHSVIADSTGRIRLPWYMQSGTYYALVEDYGRNDADQASPYTISVQTVPVDEAMANDGKAGAWTVLPSPGGAAFPEVGEIGYEKDEDWYLLPDSAVSGIRVLEVGFDDDGAELGFRFNVQVVDEEGVEVLSHEHSGGNAALLSQIKLEAGAHYVAVRQADGQAVTGSAPYALSLAVLDVDDPDESAPGNDTIDAAVALPGATTPDSGWKEGKVAFRGDLDWYSINANTAEARIFEVFFETDQPTLADYSVSIIGDHSMGRIFDVNGADGPTELKTSIYLPASTPVQDVNYFLKVADTQGDDGDGEASYWLRGNVVDIPASLPYDARVPGAVYYPETGERADETAKTITLEHSSLVKKNYLVNTGLLRFNGPAPAAGITRTTVGEVTTITMPWIGGYVDFQGDQDWFELDLYSFSPDGVSTDSVWCYDIKVEFYTPGGPVEYIWKFYRDKNNNRSMVDGKDRSNGYIASAGDTDLSGLEVDIVTPAAGTGQEFWIGDDWKDPFYFSVSDFNNVAENASPDDDWGYDAPYYFRITLVYHPGVARP